MEIFIIILRRWTSTQIDFSQHSIFSEEGKTERQDIPLASNVP